MSEREADADTRSGAHIEIRYDMIVPIAIEKMEYRDIL